MDLFKLRVKDLSTDTIYKFTPDEIETILEIHYCTSYFQFVVQFKSEDGHIGCKDLCYVFKDANLIDLMAIDENEHCEIYFE